MTSRAYFHDDTIHSMANWAAKYYGLGAVHIFWRSYIPDPNRHFQCGTAGATTFPLTGTGQFFIELLQRRSYSFLVQVLAHEIAHAVTWKEKHLRGHGPEFRKNFDRVCQDWNAHVGLVQ